MSDHDGDKLINISSSTSGSDDERPLSFFVEKVKLKGEKLDKTLRSVSGSIKLEVKECRTLAHPSGISGNLLDELNSTADFTATADLVTMAPLPPDDAVVDTKLFGHKLDPGIFSGKEGEDAKHYVSTFKRVAKANGWTDADCLRFFPCKMRGTAISWYNRYEKNAEQITWEDMTNSFKAAFQPQGHEQVAEAKLSARYQGETEAIKTYVYDVLDLCEEVDTNMPEIKKVFYIARGLKPSLLDKALIVESKTVDELIRNVERQELSKFMITQRVGMQTRPVTPAVSVQDSGMQDVIKELTRELRELKEISSRKAEVPPQPIQPQIAAQYQPNQMQTFATYQNGMHTVPVNLMQPIQTADQSQPMTMVSQTPYYSPLPPQVVYHAAVQPQSQVQVPAIPLPQALNPYTQQFNPLMGNSAGFQGGRGRGYGRGNRGNGYRQNRSNRTYDGKPACGHCSRIGHTTETCFRRQIEELKKQAGTSSQTTGSGNGQQ